MWKPYYSLKHQDDIVLAEKNEDGSWVTRGTYCNEALSDDNFRRMYVELPPRPYAERRTSAPFRTPFHLDVHQAVENGTHVVDIVCDRSEFEVARARNENALFINGKGEVASYKNLPKNYWSNSGRSAYGEEEARYFSFPLFVLIAK